MEKQDIIYQECECCGRWIDQMLLIWDLEEDRLVCKNCYTANHLGGRDGHSQTI